MISADFDATAMQSAFRFLEQNLTERLRAGLEATLESIAARAKQTTTFVDRTGALRNSIQSDGVTEEAGQLVGTVSFAATSEVALRKKRGGKRRRSTGGYPYGLAQEFGTRTGVREKRFIRDAIEAETGDLIEGAFKSALRDAGFAL